MIDSLRKTKKQKLWADSVLCLQHAKASELCLKPRCSGTHTCEAIVLRNNLMFSENLKERGRQLLVETRQWLWLWHHLSTSWHFSAVCTGGTQYNEKRIWKKEAWELERISEGGPFRRNRFGKEQVSVFGLGSLNHLPWLIRRFTLQSWFSIWNFYDELHERIR